MKGTIRNVKENGYGFITPADGGKDIFFHANDCVNKDFTEMAAGQEVEYSEGTSSRGPVAIEVSRVIAE